MIAIATFQLMDVTSKDDFLTHIYTTAPKVSIPCVV